MVIRTGEKFHLSMRRRFDGDMRRHFVGEIKEMHGSLVRAEGYFFIFDTLETAFIKKHEKRTLILQFSSPGYIINMVPPDVDLNSLRYARTQQNILVLTDHENYSLDINEFGPTR